MEIEFKGLTIKLATRYTFKENTGEIIISRKVVESSDKNAKVEVDEFLTSCWGTTEYPEDLTGCMLSVVDRKGSRNDLVYDYRCRELSLEDVKCVEAVIPQVETKVSLIPSSGHCGGYYEEGYSFAPNLKIGITKTIGLNEELETCLKVEKAK